MFKLGSRLLITAVLLATALALSGSAAGAQQHASIFDDPAGGGSTIGGIQPLGMPDSGEPDIGQTGRDRPGDGGGPGAGEQMDLSEVRYATSGMFRWIAVIWALRSLGLGY